MKRTKVLLLFLLPACVFGSSWYDQKLQGWYYFQEKEHAEEAPPERPEEAEERLAAESRYLHQLLSLAILTPTQENVETYIRAQKQWINQSNQFAQAWGKVLLHSPELSDLLATPTSSYGILAKRSLDLKNRKALLQTLSKDYFILLFFKGADPLSEKAAEVLLNFAEINGWKYKAVSLDGVGTPSLEEFEVDKGISKNLGASLAPSFFIVNPKEEKAYPVGAGLIAVSELEQNIETQTGDSNEP